MRSNYDPYPTNVIVTTVEPASAAVAGRPEPAITAGAPRTLHLVAPSAQPATAAIARSSQGRRLVLVVLSLLSIFVEVAAADETTSIARLAAKLAPGGWAELKSHGYESESLMRDDDILAYSGRAAWDGKSQQVLFIGQVHLQGPPVFIAYAARTNTWRRQPTPLWAEKLKWFHAYENNACDSERGFFYHHSSNSPWIHKLEVASDTWTALPELKAPTGHGTALEYFPERRGLVHVLGGEVWFFSEAENAWSLLANNLAMGPYHNFAVYSPPEKTVIFGGGNDSCHVYRLAADGKITPGHDAPVELGIGRSLNVVDPASGELLVLTKERQMFAYHAGDDTWRELATTDMPFTKYAGHSVSAAPITSDGVVLYFSSQPQGMQTWLYKHAEK